MAVNTAFISGSCPIASRKPRNTSAQAFISFVQLLQCTIAAGRPAGVVTMSISVCTFGSAFSSTIMANTLVPAETLPSLPDAVRGGHAVPASPSGGQRRDTGLERAARVEQPRSGLGQAAAASPATSTRGRMSLSFQG